MEGFHHRLNPGRLRHSPRPQRRFSQPVRLYAGAMHLSPAKGDEELGFTGFTLRCCRFLGRYYGCRFGREFAGQVGEVRDCDFSTASRLHLCEFCEGTAVDTLRWPPWPHVVVSDLPRSRRAWLGLELPEQMRIIQDVIGAEGSLARAVTLYLPAETDRFHDLREMLAAQSYIVIA